VTGWFRWIVLISGALTLLGVPACGEPAAERDKPKPVPADQQILAQYRKLWTETIPAATAATASARKPILAATMTDPALSDVVRGYQQLDRKGQRYYGRELPLRQSVSVNGKSGVVLGCLDSSQSGASDAHTGRKLKRGVPTNPVTVTFKQAADGVWRASAFRWGNTKKC
jgi:hypothetical protein